MKGPIEFGLGCPEGRELDHWDLATKLVAIEDGQKSTEPIDQNLGLAGEPIELIEGRNAREFPTLTDRGEADIPSRKRETVPTASRAIGG